MNNFGGDWTKSKIEILVEYAKAYLNIMNVYANRYNWKLLYFDGFAGSGEIIRNDETEKEFSDINITIGAARRIIEIENPRAFDEYYFVEKDFENFRELEKNTKKAFPKKKIYATHDDCNKKMLDLSNYLRNPKNKNYRTLAYIDPCGMQVEWRSIECLKGLPVDMWVLVPTGLGVNRLLKNNGQISDAWLERLEKFLGLDKDSIEKYFYKKQENLFGEIVMIKTEDAIKKSAKLYHTRLKSVFEYVSNAFELKNSSNSIMYHLFLTSNNRAALNIANDIVKKYNN
ncbi:MAG: three-Cys-motif partner protein TcmP [Bacteroidetes bacterium]|nr:three-Cys-motif partner protein TcmP [Bacteroidota bacterium]